MKELNALVVLLAIFVYTIFRKKKDDVKTDIQDTTRSVVDDLGVVKNLPTYLPYVLALVPIYIGYNHEQFPKLFEHVIVLYVLFLFVRAMQMLNNKETRRTPEYTLPASTLLMLLYVYHGIVPRSQNAYLYMGVHALVVLLMYRKKTTVSSLADDVALAHLIFYVFK
jgi:hypothetical protein